MKFLDTIPLKSLRVNRLFLELPLNEICLKRKHCFINNCFAVTKSSDFNIYSFTCNVRLSLWRMKMSLTSRYD